jgi:hypothetical protein
LLVPCPHENKLINKRAEIIMKKIFEDFMIPPT